MSAAVAAERALVLSGGGPVGRAWEWGLAAGCLAAGIDWRRAERIVGTSAGAVVGAMLGLGMDARESPPRAPARGTALSPATAAAFQQLALLLTKAARSSQPQTVWQQVGQLALNSATMSEADSLARAGFDGLRGAAFPASLWATTLRVRDGQLQVWTADAGSPLLQAVAASAALPGVWPPITIGAERYMDGGVRSLLNADLAAGCRRVLVVSCFGLSTGEDETPAIRARNVALGAEIEALRQAGATVQVLAPDAAFEALTGRGTKMLDGRLAPAAYAAGVRQAELAAAQLLEFWR